MQKQFHLSTEETLEYLNWKDNHDCPFADPMKQGAIGGRMTFSFTPTSLGLIAKVKCACGAELDLTHSEDW